MEKWKSRKWKYNGNWKQKLKTEMKINVPLSCVVLARFNCYCFSFLGIPVLSPSPVFALLAQLAQPSSQAFTTPSSHLGCASHCSFSQQYSIFGVPHVVTIADSVQICPVHVLKLMFESEHYTSISALASIVWGGGGEMVGRGCLTQGLGLGMKP